MLKIHQDKTEIIFKKILSKIKVKESDGFKYTHKYFIFFPSSGKA